MLMGRRGAREATGDLRALNSPSVGTPALWGSHLSGGHNSLCSQHTPSASWLTPVLSPGTPLPTLLPHLLEDKATWVLVTPNLCSN